MNNSVMKSARSRFVPVVVVICLVSIISVGLFLVSNSAKAAIAPDSRFVNIMPDPNTATQDRDAHLEIAQVGKGNTLDAHEAWGKYYFDPSKVSDATVGISKGGYGGVTDTLGVTRGSANSYFSDKNAVKYEFYLGIDLLETDGWYDEVPCKYQGQQKPSLTVYSGQMSTEGWYKIDAARFVNNAQCGSVRWKATQKSGKYVLFVRAVWNTEAPTVDGEVQGRVNAFKLGAAYATKPGNPLVGYWAVTRWAYTDEKPTTGAYSVQDRKSPDNTNGDYTFMFAPDCRLAPGQTEARYLHWSDVDYPAYYQAPFPVQQAPEFDLIEIPPGGGAGNSVLHIGPEDKKYNGLNPDGTPKQNTHNAVEYKSFKGGYTYKWVWKHIARVDGVTFWIPYDDFPAINPGGCGQWNHDLTMKAGPDGQLGTNEFKVAGGRTAVINLTQAAAGQDAGPNTDLDLTVAAANGKSIAASFNGVSTTLNGVSSCDKTADPKNPECKSTPYSRVISWKDLGRLGPAPTYQSIRNDIYAYFSVRPDAPDGARYCVSAIMSPKSNTNLGGLKSTPQQICFTIDNSLKPYISTTGADVHAGDCNISSLTNRYGDITGPPATQGNNGSVGLYIVSAADTITSFGSGGSAISNTLTFGNGGKYGCMRRPTMRAVQDDVKTAEKNIAAVKTVPYSGGANSVINLSSDVPPIGKKYVIEVAGNATVVGTSPSPVTINAPNGTVTIAGGSFGGDAGKVTDQKNLPVVMVIAKDIDISKDVKNITALLYAENTIDTCSEVGDLKSAANVNTCKNLLTLNGFAMANNFSLKRTTGSNGLAKAEDLVFNAAFYLNPPVGGGAATSAIKYLGERAPLY